MTVTEADQNWAKLGLIRLVKIQMYATLTVAIFRQPKMVIVVSKIIL